MATPPPYTGVTGVFTYTDKHQQVSKTDLDGSARPGQLVVDTTDYSLWVGDDTGALTSVGGSGGGGSTTPGGATTNIQYNSGGTFAGSAKMTFNGTEMYTDQLRAKVFHETSVTMVGNNIDLTQANYFTKTVTGPTTFTVTGIPAAGTAVMICLTLINGGTNVTWMPGTKWSNGTAPVLTVAGTDILGFFTTDGGTTWRGLILAMDSK